MKDGSKKIDYDSILNNIRIDLFPSEKECANYAKYEHLPEFLNKIDENDWISVLNLCDLKEFNQRNLGYGLLKKFNYEPIKDFVIRRLSSDDFSFKDKVALIFVLLDYEGLELKYHEKAFHIFKENKDKFIDHIKDWLNGMSIVEYCKSRISGETPKPKTKHWLYLYCLHLSKEIVWDICKKETYLNDIDEVVKKMIIKLDDEIVT